MKDFVNLALHISLLIDIKIKIMYTPYIGNDDLPWETKTASMS